MERRWCVVFAVAAACGHKADVQAERHAVVDKARPDLVRRISELEKLVAGPLPAIDQDKLAAGPALSDGGEGSGRVNANVIMIPADRAVVHKMSVGNFTAHRDDEFVFDGSCDGCLLSDAGNYLTNQTIVDQPAEIEKNLRAFLGLRYVLVISSTAKAPTAGTKDFSGGHVDGEARLYQLPDKYLGGVHFHAESSGEVQTTESQSEDAVGKDLSRNARKALHDALAQQLPGSDVAGHSQ